MKPIVSAMRGKKTINELKNNNFLQTFGYGSSLMLKLFDCFLYKEQDSNDCSHWVIRSTEGYPRTHATPLWGVTEVSDIVMSCKIMYETCNLFIVRRRLLWTKIENFDQVKLNSIQKIMYDAPEILVSENRMKKIL